MTVSANRLSLCAWPRHVVELHVCG